MRWLLAVKILLTPSVEAMDDDFNTPNALSALFEMARELNKLKTEDMAKANGLAARLRELAGISRFAPTRSGTIPTSRL